MNLKKFFDSDIHKKIMGFFRENPISIDTPRGIAAWIGYGRVETEKALQELAEAGILTLTSTTSTSGYSFTRDESIIKAIENLFQ